MGFKGTEGSGSAHFSKIRILADAIWALMRCSLNFAGNGFRQAPEDSLYRSRSAVNVGAVNPTDTVIARIGNYELSNKPFKGLAAMLFDVLNFLVMVL